MSVSRSTDALVVGPCVDERVAETYRRADVWSSGTGDVVGGRVDETDGRRGVW